jgi:hypothetical protein
MLMTEEKRNWKYAAMQKLSNEQSRDAENATFNDQGYQE